MINRSFPERGKESDVSGKQEKAGLPKDNLLASRAFFVEEHILLLKTKEARYKEKDVSPDLLIFKIINHCFLICNQSVSFSVVSFYQNKLAVKGGLSLMKERNLFVTEKNIKTERFHC